VFPISVKTTIIALIIRVYIFNVIINSSGLPHMHDLENATSK
jgi:hypothetical protein